MALDRRFGALVAAIALVVAIPAAADARGVNRVDRAEDCDDYVPAVYSTSTTGSAIRIDVVVLLDGVAKTDASEIMTKAGESYAPLGITLVPNYRKFTSPPELAATTTADPGAMIAAAKAAVGGVRPPDSDVVYLMTTKDLVLPPNDVAGYADCIGGIRYPNRAFAVGEAIAAPQAVGPVTFYVDGPAKTAAHEIGHLLGARHEHANCVEGIHPSDVSGLDPTPCTVMTNFLDLQSWNFGALEGRVIRGYAEAFGGS